MLVRATMSTFAFQRLCACATRAQKALLYVPRAYACVPSCASMPIYLGAYLYRARAYAAHVRANICIISTTPHLPQCAQL